MIKVYCKTVKILSKKILFFQVWRVLFCEINVLTVHYPTCCCATYQINGMKYWFDLQLFDMIMQKVFLHVHVVSVHVCACVYFFSVQTSWRPSVLCGAMMPTHKTHPDWWITAPSCRFTCSYINKHTQELHGHTETITGAALFTLETGFSMHKNIESAILHPFSHRKELRSRCLPVLFIFYAGEMIIIMNKLFTVAVISSGAVMHWRKHTIAPVGVSLIF